MSGDCLKPFHDEKSAYEFVEGLIWPDGPVCPRCGEFSRVGALNGASTHIGTYKCYRCRKPFSVKLGTFLQSSNVPLHKWLQAILLVSARGRKLTTTDLQAALGLTYKTASALRRRIEGRLASTEEHSENIHKMPPCAAEPEEPYAGAAAVDLNQRVQPLS